MQALQPLFEITPGAKLAPARGLRTAVAIFLALLLLAVFGHTAFGNAVGLGFLLGVLFSSFCDFGASARARLVAMSALTIAGPFVVAVGRALSPAWWLAALVVFVVTFLAGLLLAYGPLVGLIELQLTIVFVATLGIGGGPGTALPSALGFLLGGALVLLLTLVSLLLDDLWHHSVRPEAPVPVSASGISPGERVVSGRMELLFRQALLRALGAGAAAALAWGLGVPYPQWAPIVVIVCVRPKKETSVLVALQNIVGTILGVTLADLFINSGQDPLVVALVLVVVVFIAFTVKDLNYALFTFFMTNLLLLLISLSPPGVSRSQLRVFSVLVGAGIALAVTFLDDWLAQQHATRARA